MEGNVQISIKDFDDLRERADGFERKFKNLVKSLNACTVEVQDHEVDADSDEWIQIISIDAERALKLVAPYGVEFIDEKDILQFVNMDNVKIGAEPE
ncbi:hypothetical protein FC756_08555 [Lysinibacillus mangiferihumi]|uniref:Uncharacterized protein n=1 Tax=Lysinibacillus mangiferihumi TaxID=1130819 RepID=A0A4U2Z7X2_9BACI|nr:hypothetical protein [Lysinibacillus mangiferihumi]TKI70144.1 hypothetical protein FC756_08555 [Lysinibacillus mangiferihumi]